MECPSGKVRYVTKVRALLALVKIEKAGPLEEGGHIPNRAYQCKLCKGGWHLTSQEKRSPETA